MSQPLISIIIPVYNVERYLRRCLDSILAQDEKSWEAILIDDGSTDGSAQICDEYADKDLRFKVFHKENSGVSSARNLGLENTNGEWVAFVDSDDEITHDYLTILPIYRDCDVIQKSSMTKHSNGNWDDNTYEERIINDYENIFRFFIQKRTMALWDKLIKRKIIKEDRFFTNIPIGEDGLFFFTIINKVQKWGFTNCGKYIYYDSPGSAMKKYKIEERLEIRLETCYIARSISQSRGTLALFDNYFVDQYLPPLWRRHHLFNNVQRDSYFKLIDGINVRNLKYLSWKHYIKFWIIFIKSHCVRLKYKIVK